MIEHFAIIMGSMKSGTTTLFEYLKEHPEIAPCSVKEPEFFVRQGKEGSDFADYERLWEWDPERHKVALEASTSYTKLPVFPNAAENMARTGLHFKLIYIMRDPLERIKSQVQHTLLASGNLQETISEELLLNAVNYSRYAMQLDAYTLFFSLNDIFLLRFEDFAKDPQHSCEEIFRFLGLSIDGNVGVKAPANEKYDNYFKYQFAGFRKWKGIVPKWLRTRLRKGISRNEYFRNYVDSSLPSKIHIPEETIDKIFDLLREDLKKLQNNYGVDIFKWMNVRKHWDCKESSLDETRAGML